MNDSRVENAKQMVGDYNQSVLYNGWADKGNSPKLRVKCTCNVPSSEQ